MNISTPLRPVSRWLAAATLLAALAACQSAPEIRSQSAPNLDLTRYSTYGFVEKPSTDTAGYTTLTTRFLTEAVDREMQARGYTKSADSPDLLVNFDVATKDKIEGRRGPNVGFGYGGWRRGYGYGWGVGTGDDIHNYTEGTLTIDVVDRSKNELVWSGTAVGRLTKEVLNKPQPAIDQAVGLIFNKYPRPAAAQAANTQ